MGKKRGNPKRRGPKLGKKPPAFRRYKKEDVSLIDLGGGHEKGRGWYAAIRQYDKAEQKGKPETAKKVITVEVSEKAYPDTLPNFKYAEEKAITLLEKIHDNAVSVITMDYFNDPNFIELQRKKIEKRMKRGKQTDPDHINPKVLREVKRVLKTNGRVYLTYFSAEAPKVKHQLEKAGLEVEVFRPIKKSEVEASNSLAIPIHFENMKSWEKGVIPPEMVPIINESPVYQAVIRTKGFDFLFNWLKEGSTVMRIVAVKRAKKKK